jgi:putative tricarboxylic transport membrane protein
MKVSNDTLPPATAAGGREGLRDQLAAGLLMVTVAVFWWDSYTINAAEAQMYPRLILIVLAVLAALLFLRGTRMGGRRADAPVVMVWFAFLAFMACTTAYVVAVAYIGFFTASIVYIPLVAWLIGLRQHWLNALVTVIFLLATWLVFVALFARPLPKEIFWG